MKFYVLTVMVSLTIWSYSHATTYECQATGARQLGSTMYVKAAFQFTEAITDGAYSINDVNGDFFVQYDFEVGDENYGYRGLFKFGSLVEKPNYRPRKYKGYSKYERFEAFETNDWDGGGMWGYMVIQKDKSKTPFSAHYIFQAGDHMGGTMDFSCE